ncbi:uncharacterized protein LOC135951685 [Calliphora vicina]|uniref:uncharacterized protein LOC135951685 n=1 Tax=Calliphora vicina TaxID=7373 RepID=UPI00325A8EFE
MATTKLIFCCILFFTLTKTLAIPRPDNSQHTNEEHPPLTPKEHLFMFTIDGFSNLTAFYVNRAANISEYILKDATLTTTAADNVAVQEFKKNLTDFLNKYQTHKEFEDLYVLVEEYSNTTSDYYEMAPEQLTADKTIIVNILRKYGSEQLDKEFKERYDRFAKDFGEEFKKVQIHLERKMLDWFDQFKGITDMNERTVAFDKFFMLYL